MMSAAPNSRDNNIETLRVLATLLLVIYHAIGSGGGVALQVVDAHPLRLFADFLIDVRMPTFAFIAGAVFGLRFVTIDKLQTFFTGKIWRLLLPGIVAALIYWVISTRLLGGTVGSDASFLDAITLNFLHFWFLQSIFIILMIAAVIDVLVPKALALPVMVGVTAALIVLEPDLGPLVGSQSVLYLMPYFVLGLGVTRYDSTVRDAKSVLLVVAGICLIAGVIMNLQIYAETGAFASSRKDAQSVLTAFGAITLGFFLLPRIPLLQVFGPISFTIYLYHVLGTSAGRRLGKFAGVEDTYVLLAISVMCGLVGPIVLHFMLSKTRLTSAVFLGMRRRAK